MKHDFEMVPIQKDTPAVKQNDGIVDKYVQNPNMMDAVADNFPRILDLVGGYLELEKMQVQSNAVLAKMEQDRKAILAEAEAYVKKVNADTDKVIRKMEMVDKMMLHFYQNNNNTNMTGEDFSRVIISIVNEMGKL